MFAFELHPSEAFFRIYAMSCKESARQHLRINPRGIELTDDSIRIAFNQLINIHRGVMPGMIIFPTRLNA
jgi:hypothetical protein